MDTYDKNVTATPHVGGLTGLHVTFECLALLSFAANGHVIAHRNFKVIYGKSLVAVYGLWLFSLNETGDLCPFSWKAL